MRDLRVGFLDTLQHDAPGYARCTAGRIDAFVQIDMPTADRSGPALHLERSHLLRAPQYAEQVKDHCWPGACAVLAVMPRGRVAGPDGAA